MSVPQKSLLGKICAPSVRLMTGVLPVLSSVIPVAAVAASDWEAGIDVRTAYSDNANRSDSDPLSERQDEVELQLGGQYSNRWLNVSANYRAMERRYTEGSQPDRSLLVGNSELLLGRQDQPFDLLVSHSRRTVLNAPDEIDLLRNNDERTILSALPSARWRPTDTDLLMLRGHFSDIEYRYRADRDATREGGSIVWRRDLSPVDSLSLTGQQMAVRFDAIPSADYDYRAVNVGFESTLRLLSYRVQVGVNESDSAQGENLSSPAYSLEVEWGQGPGTWEFNAQRFITDNSAGSGNRGDLDDFNPGDSLTDRIDQLERTRAEVRWTHETLCQRCRLDISAFWQSDDYRREAEDKDETGIQVAGAYDVSPRASVTLSWEVREHNFDPSTARTDYQVQRWRFRYDYRFAGGLRAGLFATFHDRQSDTGFREYDELSGGVRLGYQF
ncbi:hypothetical protein [Marinimicrobium sp. ARAG 43.8]|uniref:hypothetical protein n=1 Tax=Marinimicrobium sp. ARAG 43.8 TaxID=3418719 RepID=UPI003CE9A8EA